MNRPSECLVCRPNHQRAAIYTYEKNRIERSRVGQVLDGLTCRVVLYEEMIGYYENGVSYGRIAEVSGADEARNIAEYYKQIIGKFEKQLGKDGYIETTEDLMRNISRDRR